jgi:YjbE family integral membrane protein
VPEFSAELISRILQIVLIDLVLSGDNAVVIGMAARPLHDRQRKLAIVIGGGAAIVLRVTLTSIAALLLGLPALKAIGGAVLLWIAVRLLEPQTPESETKAATSLAGAIGTILLADFIMSLDNVLGVAAASHGDVPLLIFGLLVSMAILMVGGSVFANLLDRLWWLAYLGAAVIAWTGADMIQDDGLINQVIAAPDVMRWTINAIVTVAVILIARRIYRIPSGQALRTRS